ncbi:hypothetical protein G6F62_002681 [Rhizopus arrhizus]|nr:hypothetical protein G6F23_002418 [Rhizopus arrhizus]KAG0767357.1 hypothetical protein G6F24_002861 [Rhizopus arrhizus]KAG0794698.1 hypothetical protein G6F21_002672 [Rhizopus arrhizus]KAG0802012.1 hypothetical protein G6F22_000683 [Rhizopus arrhizus]KAG0815306.1 hypothetical protein G6F20_004095 [Rhizopus arrhizus]
MFFLSVASVDVPEALFFCSDSVEILSPFASFFEPVIFGYIVSASLSVAVQTSASFALVPAAVEAAQKPILAAEPTFGDWLSME